MTKKQTEENAENALVQNKTETSEEKTSKPSWVKMSQKETEKIIIELAEKGETPSKIGMILRDKYGVPKVKQLGKKVTKILDENKVKYKTEKEISQGKIETLKSHIGKNKHDHPASRALTKKLWALQRFN